MSVNKKIAAAGIAIIKLKAMAEALSLNPILFTWLKKNFITSNRHNPKKPGSIIVLLRLIKKATGLRLARNDSNFVKVVIFLNYPASF